MSLKDLFSSVDEDSEFYRFVKEFFSENNLEQKTILTNTMLHAALQTFSKFASKYVKTDLIDFLLRKYYILQISKEGRGRNDAVEMLRRLNDVVDAKDKA